jgi:16S rRNA (cytosine1402-N4)-methyltransferase
MIAFTHRPVMPQEILTLLGDIRGKIIVDATAGGGGHLKLLAEAVGDNGLVLAFDQDIRAHQEDAALGVKKLFDKRVKLFLKSFSSIEQVLHEENIKQIDGLIADLGVSSNQLDDRERGFSFLADGPIDMRMDRDNKISAYEWLAQHSETEIANIIFNFGDERKSRAIARLIKQSWPIENSTLFLANLVLKAVRQKHWSKAHPATRTFQALRIAVNHELDELNILLQALPRILAPNGVAAFLSFHSLEDRLIKNTFKQLALNNFKILTKKPLVSSKEELEHNRRARSAKLRAITRVL